MNVMKWLSSSDRCNTSVTFTVMCSNAWCPFLIPRSSSCHIQSDIPGAFFGVYEYKKNTGKTFSVRKRNKESFELAYVCIIYYMIRQEILELFRMIQEVLLTYAGIIWEMRRTLPRKYWLLLRIVMARINSSLISNDFLCQKLERIRSCFLWLGIYIVNVIIFILLSLTILSWSVGYLLIFQYCFYMLLACSWMANSNLLISSCAKNKIFNTFTGVTTPVSLSWSNDGLSGFIKNEQ